MAKEQQEKEKNIDNKKEVKKNPKRKGGLNFTIPAMACAPLLLFGILAMAFSGFRFTSVMNEKVENELGEIASSVLLSYDMLYPGEYELLESNNVVALFKGEQEITGHNEIIDRYRKLTGAQISLFYKDTRMITTLVDENGERPVGTAANIVIRQDVINGMKSKFYKDLNIYGTDYYVYYEPIFNDLGTCVGMIAVAKTCSEVNKLVVKSVLPMIIIIAASLLIAAFIGFVLTFGFTAISGPNLPLPIMVQAVIIVVLGSFPQAIFGIIPQTIVADIALEDEVVTGESRSGMFYAARTFAMKLGQSLAMLMFTSIATIGVSEEVFMEAARATKETAAGSPLGYRIVALVASVCCIIGGLIMGFFNEKKVMETIKKVEE